MDGFIRLNVLLPKKSAVYSVVLCGALLFTDDEGRVVYVLLCGAL